MNTRHNWIAAFAGGALLAAAATLAPVNTATAQKAQSVDDAKDAKNKRTVSKALGKPLQAAQNALQAKKYPEALAHLKEADGINPKTPWDEHVINELYSFAYARTNDLPNAGKAIEATVNDGFTDPGEIPTKLKELAQINYQLKNYDKAIEFGERAMKAGVGDEDMNTIVGQSYYLKSDYKGTLKFVNEQVSGEIQKGHEPKEQTLNLILSSCIKLDDPECESKALERLVTYYPKPEYWGNLVITLFQAQGQNDKTLLNTYRLANEVDVLKKADDFTEYAQLAIEAGSPGEAQHVLEKAFQKNVFTDPRSQDKNKRLLASAQKAAQQDQASLPKITQDADAATTGDKDVGVGLAYLGYQQYDKAADELSKGISKGGLKNDGEAHLLLGIAQLKSGHKDDAVKSFKAVKGDPTIERIANLWSLHAKQA
jgi:tetratricopeptide (TPR) repeat protein